MKKIINGKMYNTETARLVGEYDSNYPRNDFNWFEEELYRKRTGEFFLYGNGNAMSPYTESCGDNSWCGSQEIIPYTEDEARRWVGKHLDADTYVELFGEVEE